MPRPFYILLPLLGLSHLITGQTAVTDSLRRLAEQPGLTDSLRLQHQKQYASALTKTDFDKGMALLEAARHESVIKKLPEVEADITLATSIVYYELGDYINSIVYDEKVASAFAKLKNERVKTWGLAAVSVNSGASYSLLNDWQNAQDYYLKGIAQFEKLKDSNSLLVSYFNLAFIYIDMQNWDKAYQYLHKSMSYSRGDTNKDNELCTVARKAAICFKLGRLKEGRQLLKTCDSMFVNSKEYMGKIYYHNAWGDYYHTTGAYRQAIVHHRASYAACVLQNDPYYLADELWSIGRSYLKMEVYDSARFYLDSALQISKRYNYMPKVKFILTDLSDYYAMAGNYNKAYAISQELLHFTDSLVALQDRNRILLFDARYQSVQKENRIKQLEQDKIIQALSLRQKNTLNYILIGTAATLALITLLAWRNYRQKQMLQQRRIAELETQQQLLAAEAVLKGEEQERTRLAKDLHDGLGGMLSGIKFAFNTMKGNLVMTPENQQAFERSMDMLDSSIKELRRVAHNMMPESLVKFGLDIALSDFCSDMNSTGAAQVVYQAYHTGGWQPETSLALGVYRMVQELVNNSMKHAQARQILVQLVKEDHQLHITVEDDGRGFDPSQLSESRGIGWSNLQSRLDYLKGTIDVQSGKDKGTTVSIDIPLTT